MDYYEGDNTGGIATIEVIAHYNILTLNPLALAPGASWLSLPFKEETGRFTPKSQTTNNGRVYAYSGRFFFHGMRSELDTVISPYLDEVAVLRIKDMNGRSYIIGGPGDPVTIAENGDTGQKYVNENGIEYTFSIEQAYKAIIA